MGWLFAHQSQTYDLNPQRGFIETSNSNYTPPDFEFLDAIGYTWTDPYRWARGSEVLSGRKFNMSDMIASTITCLSLHVVLSSRIYVQPIRRWSRPVNVIDDLNIVIPQLGYLRGALRQRLTTSTR